MCLASSACITSGGFQGTFWEAVSRYAESASTMDSPLRSISWLTAATSVSSRAALAASGIAFLSSASRSSACRDHARLLRDLLSSWCLPLASLGSAYAPFGFLELQAFL